MEKLFLNAYPLYKFNYGILPTNILLDKVKKLTEWTILPDGDENPINMITDYYDEELFSFFANSIDKVSKLYYKDEIKFTITECWINRLSRLQNFSTHTHSCSIISGLMYLDDFADCGETVFSVPDPWLSHYSDSYEMLPIEKRGKVNYLQTKVYPEKGTLLLFPAKIYHSVKPIKSNNHRYTIAFNTFPSGIISTNTSSKLKIDTMSAKDRFETKVTK